MMPRAHQIYSLRTIICVDTATRIFALLAIVKARARWPAALTGKTLNAMPFTPDPPADAGAAGAKAAISLENAGLYTDRNRRTDERKRAERPCGEGAYSPKPSEIEPYRRSYGCEYFHRGSTGQKRLIASTDMTERHKKYNELALAPTLFLP